MSTGILVHGCHLQAREWERIVWGEPPYRMGRIPKAVLLASQEKAVKMIFGTGASEREDVKEGEYTMRYLFDHFDALYDFYDIREHIADACFGDGDRWLKETRNHMANISIAELISQNTKEEIRAAARILTDWLSFPPRRMILISSPTHIARCLQTALQLPVTDLFGFEIMAAASDTCFADSTASDVVIIEPPHRADMPAYPVHKIARRIFKVGDKMPQFLVEMDKLLQDYSA